jgi:hypothetical protein
MLPAVPRAILLWRGQPDPERRTLAALVVVSLLLHAPFTPLGALWGLMSATRADADGPVPDLGKIRDIPVDLLGQPSEAEPRPRAPTADTAPAAVPVKKRKPRPRRTELDAGVAADAGVSDAGDGGPPADASVDGGAAADPVALAGRAGELADANANVRILVYTDTVRGQPLGARVGRLLGSVPQWRDFFGPGGLDPIRDFDRILIAGPQLRDSSEVLAVLRYNVDEARVVAAVGDIVRSDPRGGSWLDAGVPAATAHADRAPRVFVISPRSRLAVVTPPSAAANVVRRARGRIPFPPASGNEAVRAFVNTPWRMFIGLPVSVPKSLESADLTLTPTAHGGVSIALRIKDSSPEQAQRDRDELWALYRNNQFIPLLEIATGRLMVSLEPRDSEIQGAIELTPQQVSFVLNLVEGWFAERERNRIARPGGSELAPAPPVPSATVAPIPPDAAPQPPASGISTEPDASGPSTPEVNPPPLPTEPNGPTTPASAAAPP